MMRAGREIMEFEGVIIGVGGGVVCCDMMANVVSMSDLEILVREVQSQITYQCKWLF